MGLEFDPDYDTTAGVHMRGMAAQRERQEGRRPQGDRPFDVVLATSMLQVGVDVQRLGLMLVVGQPKNTAEYIQASSRVGRDPSGRAWLSPLGNWARPRDLAHFEQFRHYHETFYAQVEALSVTPVLADVAGTRAGRGAGQRRAGACRRRCRTGCRRAERVADQGAAGAGRADR